MTTTLRLHFCETGFTFDIFKGSQKQFNLSKSVASVSISGSTWHWCLEAGRGPDIAPLRKTSTFHLSGLLLQL